VVLESEDRKGENMNDFWKIIIAVMVGAGIVLFTLWLQPGQETACNAPITIYNEWGLVEIGRQEMDVQGPPFIVYPAMPDPQADRG